MLNFNHLFYFHVTAVEGSIKAAADRLGVTQPTVSEQLRLLERALGVELFERTPSGLKLTPAGVQAEQHARAMFSAGDRLVDALARLHDSAEVTLRVGVSVSIARATAGDLVLPLLALEGTRLSVRMGNSEQILRDLQAGYFDLVISECAPGELAQEGLVAEVVRRPALVAIAVPSAEPAPDWRNLSLLVYRKSSIYRTEVEGYLQRTGLVPAIGGELDDAFLMVEAVRGGFVAFVPKDVAQDAIEREHVKPLTELVPSRAAICVVHPLGASGSLLASAIDRLQALR